jgi:transposase InsO family protein
VIHCFVDGKSRLVTGIRVSSNNRSDTVLDLLHAAVAEYGLPSRIRGDHGTENVLVAAFIEDARGGGRGSYIWGR